MIHLAPFVFACLLVAAPAWSQDAPPVESRPVTLTEFVLSDGSRIFGTVEREAETELAIRTPAGALVTVRRAEIVSAKVTSGRIERGTFYREDPHVTRLFFTPTGRSLPRGKVSFGLFGYTMPFLQVGVTDRISVGGGTPLIFGLGEGNRPFWVTPKVQLVAGDNLQVAAGALHMFSSDGDGAGIAYTVATVGHPDKAATVGVGYGYADDGGGVVVMVGGERRARNNLKLISENYLWKGGQGLLSGGVRFVGDRFAADLVLVVPLGFDFIGALPAVSIVYVF